MADIIKKATREGFGEEIVALGEKNKNIYIVDVDIAKSCKSTAFGNAYPKQHVNVGIAEQNAAGIAAGLATTGKIPFVVTYAVFGSLRMCEMIRQEICYPNLNVKIACSHDAVTEKVMKLTKGKGVDITFLAFGNKACMRQAAEITKNGGIISEIAVMDNEVPAPFGLIQVKELHVCPIQIIDSGKNKQKHQHKPSFFSPLLWVGYRTLIY